MLDYQNIQQEIQKHLHQFLILSIQLSIQNSHALLNYSCISVYFLMMLRLVLLLYALQFHCTTINIIETAWLKCASHNKDILCILSSVFILYGIRLTRSLRFSTQSFLLLLHPPYSQHQYLPHPCPYSSTIYNHCFR